MDKISRYQIEQLMRENERLNERLNSVPAWAQALFLHAQRFYWTITRLVGLGHLHDGTRNESAIGDALARSLRAVDAPARARAQAGERLFFDATVSAHARHLSGIPRVVVEICRAAAQSGAGVPVVIENGRFCDLADKSPIVFRPGDRILVSGTLGDHGVAIMSLRENLEFETTIESDTGDHAGYASTSHGSSNVFVTLPFCASTR